LLGACIHLCALLLVNKDDGDIVCPAEEVTGIVGYGDLIFVTETDGTKGNDLCPTWGFGMGVLTGAYAKEESAQDWVGSGTISSILEG
jgi:hypothetical protein